MAQQPTPSVDDVFEGFQTRADYYNANFDPKTKQWLFLVELGHANERVWKLYRAGSYNEALADVQYTLTRFPNHPRALNLLGEIGKATNDTSMPIPYYERALKFYPQHAFTHAQYGHYLVEIGAVGAGLSELREALRLDPSLLQAQAWLAEVQGPSNSQKVSPPDSTHTTSKAAPAKPSPAPGKSGKSGKASGKSGSTAKRK